MSPIPQPESEILNAVADDTFLTDDLLRQLIGVGEVDLLVGIASHSNAGKTSNDLDAIERTFQQNFTRQRAVIVSIGGGDKITEEPAPVGSGNGTEKRLLSGRPTSLRTVHRVTPDFSLPPSPGVALRTILAAADLLRARASAVVSPATTNLTPDWISNLLRPVYQEEFDFVAPLYTRHRFQGLLARNLLYPMGRAVFGCRIRELYSDEWGFSGRLASVCLNKDVWHEEHIGTRPEAWMALSAISSDFRCCQTFLGPKLQPTAGSQTDIVEIFRQTVGNLFWCMESMQTAWLDGPRLDPVQTFGPDHDLTLEPTDLNRHRIFEMFRNGVTELEPILSTILDSDTHAGIKSIVLLDEGKFKFPSDLWVRTVYDFAASYHHDVINRDHLVQALAPLYRGVTLSFLLEHSDSTSAEMETVTEELCVEFERQLPYLNEKWKAKVEVKS